jgi:hypothetical protein
MPILAYHVEEDVTSWTPQKDAALMGDLSKIHDRLACVLGGQGKGVVLASLNSTQPAVRGSL